MELQTFLIFTLTTAIVISSPGPTAILIASQGAGNGFKQTLFVLLGIASATAIYFVLSATGVASLIVASHTLFQFIKWGGVVYLVYLGCSATLSRSGGIIIKSDAHQKKRKFLFSHGFLIAFSSPKSLIYFSAILPQFLDTSAPLTQQFIIMWAITFFLQCVIFSFYAYLGEHLSRRGLRGWLVNIINKTAGGALLFAAMKMASVTANR